MKLFYLLAGTWFRMLTLSICMLEPFMSASQGLISGTLLDEKNQEPVSGAVIRIQHTLLSATSDEKGNFSFRKLNIDSAVIEIRHISYDSVVRPIRIPANGLRILLKTKAYLSEEINIVTTRVDNKSAVAYSNLDKSEISEHNLGQDLPYFLNNTPSVVVTSDAGTGVGYTALRIRGSDGTHINVTLNGIPVNDAESHMVYWVDLPDLASTVENIQVQRGLGTSTNGAGAFGGSINILSNLVNTKAYGEVNSSFGSFKTLKNTVSFGSGMLEKGFAFEGRLSKISSDGYIDRATSDLRSAYFNAGYYGNKSSIRFLVLLGQEKTYQAWGGLRQDALSSNRTLNEAGMYEDPNGNIQYYKNQTDNYKQDYYQLLFSHQFIKNWFLNAALHYTKGKGYYEEYKTEDAFSTYGLPVLYRTTDTLLYSDFIRQRWLDNDFYGFTWSLNYQHRKIEWRTGGAGNRYTGDHFGELFWSKDLPISQYPLRYYSDKANKNDLTIYSKFIYSISNRFSVFADLQFRSVSYEFKGADGSGLNLTKRVTLNFLNPKAGLTYNIGDKQMLYASFSIGHKEPVREDYVNASPILPRAETLYDVEAGYKFSGKVLSAGINLFYMHYIDQLALTGKINDVGEYVRQNIPLSYRAGMEIEFMYHFAPRFSLIGNATFSQNKIDTYLEYIYDDDDYSQFVIAHSKTDIAFSPAITGSGILRWEPFHACALELTGKYVGKQFLDNTSDNNRKIDPYFINDLRFQYSITPRWIHEISFHAALNNILNKKYESNGYTWGSLKNGDVLNHNFYYPQAGTNFLVGLTLKF